MFTKFLFQLRRVRKRLRLALDSRLIRSSDLFDKEWYLEHNPDVVQTGADPVYHYLVYGGLEGRNPGPNFHSRWYLDTYPDVQAAGLNPLVHYLKYGRKEGRKEKPQLFKLSRLYNYSKQRNKIVFEDAPEQIYLQCPNVIGSFSGALSEGEALCPLPYVAEIEEAVIFGGDTLVIVDEDTALNDELVDFNSREFGKKTSHMQEVHQDMGVFIGYKKPDLHIKEGIFLSSGHDANYFHWMVESLPKLLLVDSLEQFKDLPLLIPAGLHKNLMVALERLNINRRPLIFIEPGSAYLVERLIVPSALSRIVDRYEGAPVFNVDIVLSHKWLQRISESLKSNINYGKKPWRKIFLTRRKGLRALGNREQLELMLLKEGFEIVELEGASLDFQIELFSQASLIVAPTGAALTNMLFCRPGTKVIVFMSNHEVTNFYFWSNLGAINNLDVTTIAGERLFKVTNYYSVHDDYVVDTELVLEEIKKHERYIDKKLNTSRKSSDILVEETIPEVIKNATKIFVVGPPRSGTTLIYSMIANDFFLPECTFVSNLMKMFEETYEFSDKERFDYYGHNLANLAEIFRKPIYDFLYTGTSKVGGNLANRFIYKDPILTRYLKYFSLFFDHSYKVVFCVRDPRDVVSSMFQVQKKQNSETDDNTLFDDAINFIFPFYQTINHIDNTADYIDKDKITFIKYEHIATGNKKAIQNLENFLRFPISSQGVNENIKGKLDEASAFYSENYGKAITTSPIGRYKDSLTSEQIAKIEDTFSYYMDRLDYK